jgi:hypothetical protein
MDRSQLLDFLAVATRALIRRPRGLDGHPAEQQSNFVASPDGLESQ